MKFNFSRNTMPISHFAQGQETKYVNFDAAFTVMDGISPAWYICAWNSATPSKNAVSTNIKHSIDTSIWCQISCQSTYMLTYLHSRYFLHFWKRIDRLLITSGIFQGKGKYSACDLKCRYRIFTSWGRSVHSRTLQLNKRWSCTLIKAGLRLTQCALLLTLCTLISVICQYVTHSVKMRLFCAYRVIIELLVYYQSMHSPIYKDG